MPEDRAAHGQDIAPDEITGSVLDEAQRRGALVLRTLPILLIPFATVLVTMLVLWLVVGVNFTPAADEDKRFSPLISLVVSVIFFSSLIVLVRLGRPTISALVLIGTWTLVTTLAALANGVTSVWPALLIMPICAAGLLLDGAASISLAILATVLVASLAWFETRGIVFPSHPPNPMVTANRPILLIGYWTALFWTVAALTSLLAGSLQRALKQSRAQAAALKDLSAQLEARVAVQTAELLAQSRETATLEERTRLAREIHDTIAQGLTGVVVQLGAAQRALAHAAADADEHLDLAQRMAREALAEARRSVWNLRAPALEQGDLADALRGLVARPLRAETTVTFEELGTSWPLPPSVESALLRVCQEALVNVAKHAHASAVRVCLEYTGDAVRLRVRDNGIGFDARVLRDRVGSPGPWGGFGLLGMRERIAALGGSLDLVSDHGAEVLAVVPRTIPQDGSQPVGQPVAMLAEER